MAVTVLCSWRECTHIHTHTQTSGLSDELCEIISPYVNRKSGGKTRCREEILCLNAKLCVPFSLSCSYFLLSAPLRAQILHLHLSSAAPCVFVHVGVTAWVCTCQLVAHIHDPGRAFGKMTRTAFCLRATGMNRQGRRRMNAGCMVELKKKVCSCTEKKMENWEINTDKNTETMQLTFSCYSILNKHLIMKWCVAALRGKVVQDIWLFTPLFFTYSPYITFKVR